jgi:ubiquinone/menaquinone biosynthesis C-methylase UbiE
MDNQLSPVKTALINQHLQGSAILDVGAGWCHYTRWLLQENPHLAITAIDHLEVPAENFTYLNVDLEKGTLPFADETFDTILAFDIIEHLHSGHQLLGEMRRVLKKGGVLIGSVPHDEDKFLKNYNLTFYHRSDVTHKRYYLKDSLEQVLCQAGLVVDLIKAEGIVSPQVITEFVVPWLKKPTRALIGALRRVGLVRTDLLQSDLFFVVHKAN